MNRNQVSRKKRPRALPNLRFAVAAVLIAVCLIRLEIAAFGQNACYDQCQAALLNCLKAANGNQTEEARCQDEYDTCGEGCIFP
jgi:hypothetical protein